MSGYITPLVILSPSQRATFERLPIVTDELANTCRINLAYLSGWVTTNGSPKVYPFTEEDGHARFTEYLGMPHATLADYIWNAATVADLVWDAHTVALNRDEYIPSTLTVEPITAEIDLGNRTAQARALLAMRTRETAAQARVEETLAELVTARELADAYRVEARRLGNEQITDGGDSRLINFWALAEENATAANFCSEYDRMAEMMNGTRRSQEFTVRGYVTVTIPFSRTVTARNESDAQEEIEGLEWSDIEYEVQHGTSWDSSHEITVEEVEAD